MKEDFEESNRNFEIHKSVEHELWVFVYYIKYLIHKNNEEYSGDEISVYQDYSQGSTSWMPFKSTVYLPNVSFPEFLNNF